MEVRNALNKVCLWRALNLKGVGIENRQRTLDMECCWLRIDVACVVEVRGIAVDGR